MVTVAYLSFMFVAILLGAALGFIGHYKRAHLRFPPEDLGLGEPLNTLTRDNYQIEKHIIGAKWDDAGYWDEASSRNLLYYVATGAAGPVLAGLWFWPERERLVAWVCGLLLSCGLQSPFCGTASPQGQCALNLISLFN
jgi:hypothetical protein